MAFFWDESGSEHANKMLEIEIEYLNEDFRQSLLTSSPALFAREMADTSYYYLFEWTGLIRFIEWAGSNQPQGTLHQYAHVVATGLWDYVLAMIAVTQVFAVRLAILILATPVFVLALIAGFTDGLVQRDLRRWGGGRESSFLYHHSKKVIMPAILSAWVVYLAMPFSIHPSFIIVPFTLMAGIAMAVSASTFKKYL
ncbi:MAG: TIGR03747 family integrating conjugative element membrane protein [gamma proteobacterium symbiont of Lucinoma myriamae]|nr:TIGR03747 family integrating conjugative element membrane protein [gamma proteobacterium symbiont of Lucinoma myriamae]MCU7817782.1 TIGR03747 family integrating conjugative element membrane protein [gamma proteobacterium symbiont of Lucinoma myriamae]MCU7833371.1 TIGR03747 family integrating conjugative element membrane protein [gamma proteobacterium symbiont of Lucinoma myriamae]